MAADSPPTISAQTAVPDHNLDPLNSPAQQARAAQSVRGLRSEMQHTRAQQAGRQMHWKILDEEEVQELLDMRWGQHARAHAPAANQRLVRYELPSVPLLNARTGQRTLLPGRTWLATEMIDERLWAERGELRLLNSHTQRLLAQLQSDPLMAAANWRTVQQLARAQIRAAGIASQNAGLFAPGTFMRQALQASPNPRAQAAASLGGREFMAIMRTAATMRAPDAMYNGQWNPNAGRLPAWMDTYSQTMRMTNRSGLSAFSLVGHELTESFKANDADGDRMLGTMQLMEAEKGKRAKQVLLRSEFPTSFLPGLEFQVEDWSVEREVAVLGGIDLRNSQSPDRMVRAMMGAWGKHTPVMTDQGRLMDTVRAAYSKTLPFIGQMHNRLAANELAEAHRLLATMGEEGERIASNPLQHALFLSRHQVLKESDEVRIQLERGIQMIQKGREFVPDESTLRLDSAWARDALLITARKHLADKPEGDVFAALRRITYGGSSLEKLFHTRLGLASATDLIVDEHSARPSGPKFVRQANMSMPKPATGRKTMLGHLEDLGVIDFQGLGHVQYGQRTLPKAQAVIMRDPLSQLQMSMGQKVRWEAELMGETVVDRDSFMVVPRMLVQGEGPMSGRQWLATRLEQDSRIQAALTVYDPSLRERRMVGELTGDWNRQALLKGSAYHLQNVKKMANTMGWDEAHVMDVMQTSAERARQLVTAYELARDEWRLPRIVETVKDLVAEMGGREYRAVRDAQGTLQLPESVHDWVQHIVGIDTRIESGSLQHVEATVRHVFDEARQWGVNLLPHVGKMGEDNVRMYKGMEASEVLHGHGQNLKRAMTGIEQGAGSPAVNMRVGFVQLNPEAFLQHLQQEGGLTPDQARELMGRMHVDPTRFPRGAEYIGQETYIMSSSAVDKLHQADLDSGLLTAEELRRAPVRKVVSRTGEIKVHGLFDEWDFGFETHGGVMQELDMMGTVEGQIQRSTIRQVVEQDDALRGADMRRTRALAELNEASRAEVMDTDRGLRAFESYTEATPGGRLVMFKPDETVEGGVRKVYFGPEQARILVNEMEMRHVLNSTELGEHGWTDIKDELFGRTSNDPVSNKVSIAQVDKLLEHMGLSEEERTSALTQALKTHRQGFNQSQDMAAESTMDFLTNLTSDIGLDIRPERLAAEEMAARTMGRSMMDVVKPHTTAAGQIAEALNASGGQIANEVFGSVPGTGRAAATSLADKAAKLGRQIIKGLF